MDVFVQWNSFVLRDGRVDFYLEKSFRVLSMHPQGVYISFWNLVGKKRYESISAQKALPEKISSAGGVSVVKVTIAAVTLSPRRAE